MSTPPVAALVLGAGEGRRMGSEKNKVFLDVAGRPILLWSLELFTSAQVDRIFLVIAESDRYAVEKLVDFTFSWNKTELVVGGATRQQSEWNGLHAAREALGPNTIVLVHDAARPFAPWSLLPQLVVAARDAGGAVPAVPAPATVVAVDDGLVTGFPTGLWAAQTPQAFRLDEILQAHRRAREDAFQATDTAAVFERAGGTVRIVEGSPDNIKITTPDDLRHAEAIGRWRSA